MLDISAKLLEQVNTICVNAGIATLEIYQRDFSVLEKDDKSPLTEADLASHKVIVAELNKAFPTIPVLSEEAADINWQERQTWDEYWLIDPLDGTKEFIKQNGEFTINIALIQNNKAVLGSVYAPALNTVYSGAAGIGAFKQIENNQPLPIYVEKPETNHGWKVVGSRSHQSPEIVAFLADYPEHELVPMGSSLKLCLVAEGYANLYPRLGPTSEWDTAAAQAVLEAAGGSVVVHETDEPLLYNTKESILNPYFIARSW
jgi:3'(2'), 5'-bisphosphate nucleotidase